MPHPPRRLEILIHGVSNTPPESMLGVDVADIRLVAGDELTGFYRPVVQPTAGVVREAYSWGSVNSRAKGTVAAASRAAWLLLLPFALVNVAYWSRPGLRSSGTGRRLDRSSVGAALMRVAALGMTALMTSTATYVGVDLVAWQCHRGGDPLCPSLPSWTEFLADSPWDEPARRIAVGALVPLALLGLLWFVSRKSLQRYEERFDPSQRGEWPRTQLLEKARFWSGSDRLLRLQRLHLALGIATLVVLSGYPVARLSEDTRVRVGGLTLPWLTTAAGALLAVAVGYVAIRTTRDAPEFDGAESGSRAPGRLLAAGASLLAAHLLALVTWYYRIPESGTDADLPGVGAAPLVLTGALVVLAGLALHLSWQWGLLVGGAAVLSGVAYLWAPDRLVAFGLILGALLLVGWWLHRSGTPDGDPAVLAWRGAAPGVLLGAALATGLLYSTATAIGAANWLNGDSGVDELVAANRVASCAHEREVNPTLPCPALLTQRPADRESLGEATLSTSGDVTLEKGRVTVTGSSVRVISGRLRGERVFRSTADPPYDARVPSVRLASGTVTLTGTVLRLDDSVVLRAGDDGVEGQVAVPSGTLDVGTLRGEKPVEVVATDAGPTAVLSVPVTYIWLATTLPLSALATLLVLGWAVWRNWRSLRAGIQRMLTSDVGTLGWSPGQTLQGKMLSTRRTAALAHRPEVLIARVGVVVMVATLGALAAASTGSEPWRLNLPQMLIGRLDNVGLDFGPLRRFAEGRSYFTVMRILADAGLYLAVAVAGLIALLGALLQRSATLRRTVGIVWDLTAFWPRAAHPFGPPCYAERAVPDIFVRTTWAMDDPTPGGVVLSGHSLGAVLAVATIFRLDPERRRRRVALLTYGCQLRLYLGRLFPDVLGAQVLGNTPWERPDLTTPTVDEGAGPAAGQPPASVPGSLANSLTTGPKSLRWMNLFRRTDHLGVRVWSDHPLTGPAPYVNTVDRYVPEVVDPEPGDPVPPTVASHSGYPQTREYADALDECLQLLP